MHCPACRRSMRPLFTSCACDYCDGLIDIGRFVGFAVVPVDHSLRGRSFLIFRSRTDAALWRSAQAAQTWPIREVRCEFELVWRKSSGSLEGVTLADRPYEIYPDHRFPPASNRAFLASPQVEAAAA